ncbi:MAG: SpoIIE family protein phosphatase [Steroidobacteraceae bacterium]|nr:SpoIIE family protein phosphatase [Deltaproteobacteria bacterium]
MKNHYDFNDPRDVLQKKLAGFGEDSLRKTYYPELQHKLDELERFKALLDQSNDCIFLIHFPDRALIDVNESTCRQLGCSRREILSSPLDKFVPEETLTRICELATVGQEHGSDQDTIITRLNKCFGGWIPVEITIRLVTFNKELYGVAVARDITERLRAEKVLLENSRMLRDMELARQIQLSLLPAAPPVLSGVELAGCCVPATHVGGDYYDYYLREDGQVDLVIADVSGHSIGAALMMVEFRSLLRSRVHSFSSTGDMLAFLNDLLYEDLDQSGLFITLFFIKYDPLTRTLAYSNAGHVLPLLFTLGGGPREFDAEGLILGVRKGEVFEEKQIRMQPGDMLFLHTDGILESENSSGEQFGIDRLCAIVQARHSEAPQAIIDAVLREVSIFRGTAPQEDDVTMLVMKVI